MSSLLDTAPGHWTLSDIYPTRRRIHGGAIHAADHTGHQFACGRRPESPRWVAPERAVTCQKCIRLLSRSLGEQLRRDEDDRRFKNMWIRRGGRI